MPPMTPPPPSSSEESILPGLDAAKLEKELLDELEKDYKRLKKQKARKTGGVEGRVLLNLAFIGDEQHVSYKNQGLYSDPQDANKLYLTFNVIAPRFFKLIGRISGISIPYKARPDKKDPKAIADAEVVDRLILAMDEKLDQASKTWETLWWMGAGGTAFIHTCWIPNVTQELTPQYSESGELLFKDLLQPGPDGKPAIIPESQMQQSGRPPEHFELYEVLEPVGDVGCEVLGPLNVFVDQGAKDLQNLAPDQWVHIAKIRTAGWVKENFPEAEVEPDKDVSIVSSSFHQLGEATGGTFLKDMIPIVQGSSEDGDAEINLVIQSYAPISQKNPKGKYVCWVPGKKILHNAENPYKEIPLVDFHWKPVTTNFWTGDYITGLIAPQRFINKRLSQLGEQSNNALYTPMLLGPGMDASDIPADFPGTVKNGLDDGGNPKVQRMAPPELPSWFMQSIERVMGIFNDVAGGADLFQDQKFPGQLRGPMAVPMLQEILDTAWGPLYQHIGERMARVQQQRLNIVKEFYPPARTLHYTDRTQKDEVLEFHNEEILKSGTNYNISIERGAIVPELRALREARVRERLESPLGILYMDERTGRLDKTKIAADLEFGDTGREGKEAQYRKLALQMVEMLWKGQPLPPPLPFYDHAVMMDELEGAMATTEFLRASPPIQQAFLQRWNQHQQFMAQEAAAQQQALSNGMIQGAVAQATQQAAAMAAADAVHAAQGQLQAQEAAEPGPQALTKSAFERKEGQNASRSGRPVPGNPPGRR